MADTHFRRSPASGQSPSFGWSTYGGLTLPQRLLGLFQDRASGLFRELAKFDIDLGQLQSRLLNHLLPLPYQAIEPQLPFLQNILLSHEFDEASGVGRDLSHMTEHNQGKMPRYDKRIAGR